MQRHHEKRRDMARSILPSSHRVRARVELAQTKRAHRHAIRQALTSVRAGGISTGTDDDRYGDWDERADLRFYPDADIRSIMDLRRSYDKVNPLIRWAVATTADLPFDARLPHLRAALPDGLIGNHALSHLARERALRQPAEHERIIVHLRSAEGRRRAEAELAGDLAVIRTVLVDVVDQDLVGLNRWMKTCDAHNHRHICRELGCRVLTLAGRHDIDTFVHDVHALAGHGRCCTPANRLPVRRLRAYLAAITAMGANGTRDRPRRHPWAR